MSGTTVHITDQNFEEAVLKASGPVLVDYWAEWCGPCKAIAPVLEEVAKEFAGRLVVAKLNIDESPDTPARYGVRGIPTLMLFDKGEIVATKVGALGKMQLSSFIESNI